MSAVPFGRGLVDQVGCNLHRTGAVSFTDDPLLHCLSW